MSFLKNIENFYKKADLRIENELLRYYLLKYSSISETAIASPALDGCLYLQSV